MKFGLMKEALDMIRLQVDKTTEDAFTSLRPTALTLDADHSRISTDEDLKPQGQAKALILARQKWEAAQSVWDTANIGHHDKVIADAQERIDRKVKAAVAPDPSDHWGIKATANEAERQHRFREIRAPLRDAPTDVVEDVLRMTSDPEVAEALETAPPRVIRIGDNFRVEPMVRPGVIAQMKMARAATLVPEEVARLQSLLRTRATLAHWSAVLRGVALQIAPLGPSEGTFIVDGKRVPVPTISVR